MGLFEVYILLMSNSQAESFGPCMMVALRAVGWPGLLSMYRSPLRR